jgi:hypothetical protein
MTYRITGRATRYEEQILRNIDRNEFVAKIKSEQYTVDGNEVTPKTKYKELKAIFDKGGWAAFDKTQTALFDDLTAVYGERVVDSRAATIAAEFVSMRETLDRSFLDKRGDSERTESAHYLRILTTKLGRNVTVLGDRISRLKCCSDGVWHDAFSTDVILSSPCSHRAILNEWRLKYPEKDFPDFRADGSGIIPTHWTPPRKNSNKHTAIADELKIVLDYYHALRNSNEPIQINFFIGDNDNAPAEDDNGEALPPLNAAGEWEIRPSVKETMRAIAGVEFDVRPAFTDSLGNHRPEMVVPIDGVKVERDKTSRTITERQATGHTGNNKPPSNVPPVLRLGNLFLATTDDFDSNDKGSARRGEIIEANGYRVRDRALAPKESSAGQKDKDARRRAELSGVIDTPSRVVMLSKKAKAAQAADKARQASLLWRTGSSTKPDPALSTVPMALDKARAAHNISPGNDDHIYSGLPWQIWKPEHLDCSKGSSPLLDDSPEEYLIEKESRRDLCSAKSALSTDEIRVFDSFLCAENLAQLGRETGDEGKHERTQERNAQRRILQVAAKLDANVNRIAA